MKRLTSVLLFGALFAGCGGGGGGSSTTDTTTTCQNYSATVSSPVLWTELSPGGTLPDARSATVCSYDAGNDKLIVHGGKNGSTTFNDTWVLTHASGEGGTPSWQQLTASSLPTARNTSIGGYNSAKNIMVSFGGVDSNNLINMELWLLTNANGSESTAPAWTKAAISGTAPSNRTQMSGVYDEASDMIVFFGGEICTSTSCTHYNETWTIRDVTTAPVWQQLATSGTTPPARSFHATSYDRAADRLIIFAGNPSTVNPIQSSASINDTWILFNVTGGAPTWSQAVDSTANKPDPRGWLTAVHDDENKRLIAFGGKDGDNYARNDTWILMDTDTDTPVWAEYDTGTPKPSGRMEQCAVYTGSDKNKMIVFGGNTAGGVYANDTWVLTNANGIPDTAVSKITVESASSTVCTGYTVELSAVATDASGNELSGVLYTWSSSNTAVATVTADGEVTAVGAGTAVITVTAGGVTTQYTITVSQPASSTTDDTSSSGFQYWKGSMVNSYNRFNFYGEPALTVSGKPWMIVKYDSVNNKVLDCEFGLSEVTQTQDPQYDPAAPEPTLSASSIENYDKMGLVSPVDLMVTWNSEYETHNKTIVNGVQEFSFESNYVSAYSVGFAEAWDFTYTSDTMVGDVTNIDDYLYMGATSAPKAFNMTRLPL